MSNTKRISVSARVHRAKNAREDWCPLRPKSADRVVRWIGTGKRRQPERADEPKAEVSDPHIVRLSWADTFGRPPRAAIQVLGQAAANVQVLQFQRRVEV